MRPAPVLATTPVVLLKGVADPLQQAGLAIARSLGRWGVPVHGVYADPGSPDARSRFVRTRWAWDVGGAPAAATLAFLQRCAGELAARPILIPTDDVAAMFVDEHSDALHAWFTFPQQPPGLARRLADKREMQRLCTQHGVETPRCIYPSTRHELVAALDGWRFPAVLKSMDPRLMRQRAGAKSVTIAADAAQLLAAYDAMEVAAEPNLMLQEYIPGDSRAVWMFNGYFDDQSICRFGMTGQKIRQSPPSTGATSLGECVGNPAVYQATVQFMRAIGYRGILDLGWRFDARDGRYKLLDVNPRVGATFRLFVGKGGMDVARALYLDQTGQPVPEDAPSPGRRWAVEMRDLGSARELRAAGCLSAWAWLRSYARVRETAWFAARDPAPFAAMLQAYARRSRRRERRARRMAAVDPALAPVAKAVQP
jgi:predicted ATP-grasp superfamily ATP-dependent carboligase